MSIGVKFSPTIELGHLFQALVAAATLTGWALWGYANIQAQIAALHNETELLKQRVLQDEQLAVADREERRARDLRLAQVLDKITEQLGELKGDLKAINGPKR